jgi:pimeloyl-ACP methyl ester carboxylesterase
MATFVLVHGAWASGWFWHKLAPLLMAAGHEVFAPTLTGLGERAHLLSRDVGLGTHIKDVLGVLEYEDLRGVVLVGWSYGGRVISVVAHQAPERLAHLVYLDASIQQDDRSALDQMEPAARAALEERVRREGDGWKIPPWPVEGWMHYVERGELLEGEARLAHSKLRPQPFKADTEAFALANSAAERLPRTYIECTLNKPSGRDWEARHAEESGWRMRRMEAAHSVMLTHPFQLAALLAEAATAAAR